MQEFNANEHWQTIYSKKAFTEVSWYQKKPTFSLNYLEELAIPKDANIIDIGGGDSHFVDHLLELGYVNITVLDISENAILRAKKRLGSKAQNVDWIVSDVNKFKTKKTFDFWHDRAAFHFLRTQQDIDNYKQNIMNYVAPNGHAVIGTFSENGPKKCSGIEVSQYTEDTLEQCFDLLTKIDCKIHQHKTPFDTVQEFVFCTFKKD